MMDELIQFELDSSNLEEWINESSWIDIAPTRRMDDWIMLELDSSNQNNK